MNESKQLFTKIDKALEELHSVFVGGCPWWQCSFRFAPPRSIFPVRQPGIAWFLLLLRLPAGDQRPAPGGDRSIVWKPALLLRCLWFGRGSAGRIHPSQRFKLPSIGQRRIRRGLGRVWVAWLLRHALVGSVLFSFFCVSWGATGNPSLWGWESVQKAFCLYQ